MADFENAFGFGEIFRFIKENRNAIDANKMNEFKETVHEFYLIVDKYDGFMDDLIYSAETSTKQSEFGIQSKCMHRGYYCPSPVYELIVGGTKRGKLTKRLTKAIKEYYKYNYDGANRMILIEEFTAEPLFLSPYRTEFIINEGKAEYGITFNNMWKMIDYISKTVYEDGIIKSYSAGCYTKFLPADKMSVHHEEYAYTGKLLTKATVYYGITQWLNGYDKKEYFFKYDDAGKICGYDVTGEFQGTPFKETYSVKK